MTNIYLSDLKVLPMGAKIKVPYFLKQQAEDMGCWAEEVVINESAMMRRDFPAGMLGPPLTHSFE
jgi:hypothetical protein